MRIAHWIKQLSSTFRRSYPKNNKDDAIYNWEEGQHRSSSKIPEKNIDQWIIRRQKRIPSVSFLLLWGKLLRRESWAWLWSTQTESVFFSLLRSTQFILNDGEGPLEGWKYVFWYPFSISNFATYFISFALPLKTF